MKGGNTGRAGREGKASPDENPKSACPAAAAEAYEGIAFNLFS